jgi:chorismate mutase/prephenate dehydratase
LRLAAKLVDAPTFDDVFGAVVRGEAQEGLVPIENSIEGSVPSAVDALVANDLLIRGESELEVSQALLTRATSLNEIQRVYSHPQPLGQCRAWLAEHLRGASLVPTSSTTAGVREAMNDPAGAAIAGRFAAEIYDLPVLRDRIEDHPDNRTRFVIVSRHDARRTGNDRTTVAFSLHDGSSRGALLRVLSVFDETRTSLSRIESRPSRQRAWDYVFIADLEGHRDDTNVAAALERLRETCPMVKHLGSYPRAGDPRPRIVSARPPLEADEPRQEHRNGSCELAVGGVRR